MVDLQRVLLSCGQESGSGLAWDVTQQKRLATRDISSGEDSKLWLWIDRAKQSGKDWKEDQWINIAALDGKRVFQNFQSSRRSQPKKHSKSHTPTHTRSTSQAYRPKPKNKLITWSCIFTKSKKHKKKKREEIMICFNWRSLNAVFWLYILLAIHNSFCIKEANYMNIQKYMDVLTHITSPKCINFECELIVLMWLSRSVKNLWAHICHEYLWKFQLYTL